MPPTPLVGTLVGTWVGTCPRYASGCAFDRPGGPPLYSFGVTKPLVSHADDPHRRWGRRIGLGAVGGLDAINGPRSPDALDGLDWMHWKHWMHCMDWTA